MLEFVKKISSANRNKTTYRVGLLQAKAFRILKQRTSAVLEGLGISTIEWAFLGLLSDQRELRYKDAASALGVEPPFVTSMVTHLGAVGLVAITKDESDSRVKILSLTVKGVAFVISTEVLVRSHMKYLVQGASAADLLGYLAVMERIIANDENARKEMVR